MYQNRLRPLAFLLVRGIRTLNLKQLEKYSNEARVSKCVSLGSMIVMSGRQEIHSEYCFLSPYRKSRPMILIQRISAALLFILATLLSSCGGNSDNNSSIIDDPTIATPNTGLDRNTIFIPENEDPEITLGEDKYIAEYSNGATITFDVNGDYNVTYEHPIQPTISINISNIDYRPLDVSIGNKTEVTYNWIDDQLVGAMVVDDDGSIFDYNYADGEFYSISSVSNEDDKLVDFRKILSVGNAPATRAISNCEVRALAKDICITINFLSLGIGGAAIYGASFGAAAVPLWILNVVCFPVSVTPVPSSCNTPGKCVGAPPLSPPTTGPNSPPPPTPPLNPGVLAAFHKDGFNFSPRNAGGCGGGPTTSWGDPHQITFDGLKYDFQTVGEYMLVESPDGQFEVQTRQEPYGNSRSASVNTAIAVRMGVNAASLYVSPQRLVINGEEVDIDSFQSRDLGDGNTVSRAGNVYKFESWSGSYAEVQSKSSYLNTKIWSTYEQGTMSGLMGDMNGNPSDDLIERETEFVQENLSNEFINRELATSWRVREEESLFDYLPEQTTETFTDLSFPGGVFDPSLANIDAVQDARIFCSDAGLTGEVLESCIFDIVLTGNEEFADSYLSDVPEPTVTVPPAHDEYGDDSGNLVQNGDFELGDVGSQLSSLLYH